jgi:hypothetical protein
MERIDIEKLGEIVTDNPPYSVKSQDLHLSLKQLAEKVNELIEKINKLEKFTGNNLTP